jgi:hypothetical protein
MQRKGNWQQLAWEYMQERLQAPFQWGTNDCACLAFGQVEAITGENLIPDFMGKYNSLAEGIDLIKQVFGADVTTYEDGIVRALERANVQERPSVAFAQRGDLVLYDGPNGPTLGVVSLDGVNAYFPLTHKGLTYVPVSICRRAWMIL